MNFSVTRNGEPLSEELYTWNEETKTFSTEERDVMLDFSKWEGCTFNTGDHCTFNTGYKCTFNTGSYCTFNTGDHCTFKTSYNCTFKTSYNCTFNTGDHCTFKTSSCCTFNTGYDCAFDTYDNCTFNTGHHCTFYTGNRCTFNTYSNCMFKTSHDCTFNTIHNCTFDTTGNCTFNIGDNCVIIRRDRFEVIQPEMYEVINLCPSNIPGYISKRKNEDAFYKEINGKRVEHIIADGILSEVIKKRGNVYHVKNYDEDEITYLIKDGELYSHGTTLKEARDSLKFKISDRDTSKYENFTLDTELTELEAIGMYRVITGACEEGTKYFYNNVLAKKDKKDKYTVKEVIELTKGQYNHNKLVEFF